MAIDIQHMTRNDLSNLLCCVYQEMKRRVHKDAYEDEYVFKGMDMLDDLANGGLNVILEISDDYAAEEGRQIARDFYNDSVRAYQEA